jgi:flagellar hook assembly protein FlgD
MEVAVFMSPTASVVMLAASNYSFELGVPTHARLKVFDAGGRLVTTLVDEQRAMGRHEIVWNGRNSAGLSVTSGVYFTGSRPATWCRRSG